MPESRKFQIQVQVATVTVDISIIWVWFSSWCVQFVRMPVNTKAPAFLTSLKTLLRQRPIRNSTVATTNRCSACGRSFTSASATTDIPRLSPNHNSFQSSQPAHPHLLDYDLPANAPAQQRTWDGTNHSTDSIVWVLPISAVSANIALRPLLTSVNSLNISSKMRIGWAASLQLHVTELNFQLSSTMQNVKCVTARSCWRYDANNSTMQASVFLMLTRCSGSCGRRQFIQATLPVTHAWIPGVTMQSLPLLKPLIRFLGFVDMKTAVGVYWLCAVLSRFQFLEYRYFSSPDSSNCFVSLRPGICTLVSFFPIIIICQQSDFHVTYNWADNMKHIPHACYIHLLHSNLISDVIVSELLQICHLKSSKPYTLFSTLHWVPPTDSKCRAHCWQQWACVVESTVIQVVPSK